ncbi:30S ribosomal protein S19e [Tritrichomonas foetus]|uniref:30S ribosomal protein S19e n=1 Tax=Tritrichomonas foetus TaxID=1144522 RepID=A0A1J4JFR5_9EUKA|nr:30S ribosomal protein S19e [Tritrichomonas foetus]|eukprot:OHS96068.1 30S ribosomal protein S19e [Tritrichomonas foetus]
MIGAATGHKGSNVREVCPALFTEKLAQFFQNNKTIEAPKWADLVKTGALKQMPPNFQNWWYTRAASICRQVYLHPHTSVSELRHRYGASINNGVAPRHHAQSSGKVIRTILNQLESAGFVKKEDGNGRSITPRGQKQLDTIASEIKKAQ